MHLLKFNCEAKTFTEVPPGEFAADSDCRYFYVQSKHVTVPISTPDGIGEIVWQHPDYQPPSPANAMTDQHQHRATPELWAAAEKWGANTMDMANCLLELRNRIEVLEAAQHAHVTGLSDADIKAAELEWARTAPGMRSDDLRAASAADPQQLTLVEQVTDGLPFRDADQARAAIRVVAQWLREQDPEPSLMGRVLGQISTPCGVMADLLDNEASR
jgi:hypothetical protein